MTAENPKREIEEALSIGRELGDEYIIAQSLSNLGRNEATDGNYVKGRSLLEQSLDIWRRLEPKHKMERVLTQNFLGDNALQENDLKKAQLLYEDCINVFREIGDQNFLAYVVWPIEDARRYSSEKVSPRISWRSAAEEISLADTKVLMMKRKEV